MATDYGRDTSCLTGLRTGRLVSGARIVAEAAYRRVTTPHGMLQGGEDEANYGFDLADKIGSVATAADAAALPGQVQAELLKDERIQSVDVNVNSTIAPNGAVSWVIEIDGLTADGPFSLVLSVDDVTLDIIEVSPGT